MVTFTIHIPPMLAYIPYMDPMGHVTPQLWQDGACILGGFRSFFGTPLGAQPLAAVRREDLDPHLLAPRAGGKDMVIMQEWRIPHMTFSIEK
jgi:hypothetical protein